MKRLFLIFCLLGLVISCVSKLDLGIDDEKYTIINGVLTNSFLERSVFVSQREGQSLQSTPISARGTIYKDGEFEANLVEYQIGELQLPIRFRFEEGATYHLQFITADSQRFMSYPQTILPRFKADSMSFNLGTAEDVRSDGGTYTRRVVNVFVHLTLSENEKRFFRWQVDESWAIKETPNLLNPNDIIKVCYLSTGVEEMPSTIMAPEKFQTGSVAIKVATRFIDATFLERHYFSAYTHTIDKRNYDFYAITENLSRNLGTYYDEVPAPVVGNIYSPDDKRAKILGHVEMAQADTVRLAIDRDQIPAEILSPCSINDPCPIFELPNGLTEKKACFCHDCEKVFGIAALIKPWYWD